MLIFSPFFYFLLRIKDRHILQNSQPVLILSARRIFTGEHIRVTTTPMNVLSNPASFLVPLPSLYHPPAGGNHNSDFYYQQFCLFLYIQHVLLCVAPFSQKFMFSRFIHVVERADSRIVIFCCCQVVFHCMTTAAYLSIHLLMNLNCF